MQTKINIRSFGVLEIILSIGIFAAFSVMVLRLFVTASDDEKKVGELDSANYAAVSYIEEFKSGETPFDILSEAGCTALSAESPAGTTPMVKAPDSCSGDIVSGSGLTAHIEIQKDSENAGGELYKINVEMIRTSDGTEILSLSGLKYFSD